MKSIISYYVFSIFTLASHVTAASSSASRAVAIRQLRDIETLAYNLSKNITVWDSSNNATNYPSALTTIHDPATIIAGYLYTATKELQEFKTIYGLADAFRLAGATQDLAYAVNITVAHLNRREPEMTSIGIGKIVQGDVQNITNATNIFANLLLSYVPPKLRPIALNLKAQAVDSLEMGYHCFNATGKAKEAYCNTAEIDSQRTHKAALRWGAIRNNGDPIA